MQTQNGENSVKQTSESLLFQSKNVSRSEGQWTMDIFPKRRKVDYATQGTSAPLTVESNTSLQGDVLLLDMQSSGHQAPTRRMIPNPRTLGGNFFTHFHPEYPFSLSVGVRGW